MKRLFSALGAVFLLLPTITSAQSTLTSPYAIAQLVKTACIFRTRNPNIELPRSHAAFKAAGLPTINEGPHMGFYGDPSGSYFISNLTDDDNIACAAVIQISDLNRQGYDFLIQEVANHFKFNYGDHVYDPGEDATSWIDKHGDGTETVITIAFHKKNGTSIASVATLDD